MQLGEVVDAFAVGLGGDGDQRGLFAAFGQWRSTAL
jgi:hypothetical protein